MMYSYLKPYINPDVNDPRWPTNAFYPVSEEVISRSEQRLGVSFPSQLRIFYQEIGYGTLALPHTPPPSYDFFGANLIHSPDTVADIIWEGENSGVILRTAREILSPGDLPFFEIGDGESFLVMKVFSDNPNSVWNAGLPIKIEDSFEKFIWRLYYEDPGYYGKVIEDYLEQNQLG